MVVVEEIIKKGTCRVTGTRPSLYVPVRVCVWLMINEPQRLRGLVGGKMGGADDSQLL